MEVITKSAYETKELGKKLAADLNAHIFALTGNLGSGKTTFVQGFAERLGIEGRIISPTFILMRKYKIHDSRFMNHDFYHVDLYRLEENIESEVRNLGLTDIWEQPQNIVVIEWAEKIADLIPKSAIWIKFENLGENERKLTISH